MRTTIFILNVIAFTLGVISVGNGSSGAQPLGPVTFDHDGADLHVVKAPSVLHGPESPSIGPARVAMHPPPCGFSPPSFQDPTPKVPPNAYEPRTSHAYECIQKAIDAARPGDVIVVLPGVYMENIDFKGKAVTLTSAYGPELTVIDGRMKKSVVAFQSGEGADSIIEGFTLTNGIGTLTTVGPYFGGGVFCRDSSPVIRGNIIKGNDALTREGSGGGIACVENAEPLITDNVIEENTAAYGGGIYMSNHSGPLVRRNRIMANTAKGLGGGICAVNCGLIKNGIMTPTMTDNLIYMNQASSGGGLYSFLSMNVITNNTFFRNDAAVEGGGMCFYNNSEALITNTILWEDQAYQGSEITVRGTSSISIKHSLLMGMLTDLGAVEIGPEAHLYWGVGMMDKDPLFIEEGRHDFHVYFTSPCKDMGTVDAPALSPTDWEGDPRVADGAPDIGADEQFTHLYCVGDAAPGGLATVRTVGRGDAAPAFLWVGAGALSAPMVTPFGDWYLDLPVLVQIDLGGLSPDGVAEFDYPFPPTFPAPVDIAVQGLVKDQLTNLCLVKVR
jgi:hypothetical protein